MAAIARRDVPVAIGDAFATPFASGSFAAVAALRLAFHYPEIRGLLAEMRRVTRVGGSLVLDTYRWSPRSAIALGARAWGGRVQIHSRTQVAESAAALGLRVDRTESCFLFSPYLYRLAPLTLERAFESLERRVPASWLCRVFWKLTVLPGQ
jgi:SAM-dependent methyltransferase